ncbi:hypothetical protein BDF21DRAFT_395578 [Thamnidium elegans]|nr:hypothetical protein BDF21DRAFT_395578 [Thamnidium elegans]
MELKNWKCKCIAYLCRNVIIDFTNKDQLKLIGVALEKLNSRFQLFVERAERDLTPLSDATKKIENHASAKTCLKKIEAHNYANSNERATKMIYVHILDQIMNKPILFHGSSRKHFSEMSFLVKFWGPVIELFFDANQCCHWRVRSPIINNPLKSALITKVHLNAVLKRIPYLPAAKIKTVVVPMIQIMGLSCVVYGMNIIDKKVYTLQKISSFNYPSTQREVKSGGIKSLLDGFALVEYMIESIEKMIVEYSRTPNNDMRNIKNGRKGKANIKTIDIDQYISPVIKCPSSKNVEDEVDRQEDDEQENEEQEDEE